MYIYDNISCSILLRGRNVLEKKCWNNQNPILRVCSETLFRKSCPLWDNAEKCGAFGQDPDDKVIWRKLIASWISKATDIYAACVIIIAFPRLQWLREPPSLLRLYVHRLSYIRLISQNGI